MIKSCEKNLNLSGNALKLIAILAMTIDHVAWTFSSGYNASLAVVLAHIVGRITAPIMWFFVAEGYKYTRNKNKYAFRLLLFAIISHFAYVLCFSLPIIPFSDGEILNQTSVIWGLFLGLTSLMLFDSKLSEWKQILLFALILLLAFPCDWSCISVLAICYIKDNDGNFKRQMLGIVCYTVLYAIVYAVCLDVVYGIIQLGVVLSIPLLHLYSGKRGGMAFMKWFFYLYYPLHLIALAAIGGLI